MEKSPFFERKYGRRVQFHEDRAPNLPMGIILIPGIRQKEDGVTRIQNHMENSDGSNHILYKTSKREKGRKG